MGEIERDDEAILDYLESLDSTNPSLLLDIISTYSEVAKYPYLKVYFNDLEFIENHFSNIGDLFNEIKNNDNYSVNDEYVMIDGNNNLTSRGSISELVSLDEIAEYILNNDWQFRMINLKDKE